MTSTTARITIGVDTHKDTHVAHGVEQLGRPLGTQTMAPTVTGYRAFVDWARGLGQLDTVGRPNRQRRAGHGKIDSEDAAIVLAGEEASLAEVNWAALPVAERLTALNDFADPDALGTQIPAQAGTKVPNPFDADRRSRLNRLSRPSAIRWVLPKRR